MQARWSLISYRWDIIKRTEQGEMMRKIFEEKEIWENYSDMGVLIDSIKHGSGTILSVLLLIRLHLY